jgi:hypothetical protein
LLIITEREFVLENADWAGGYLYKNAYYANWGLTPFAFSAKLLTVHH